MHTSFFSSLACRKCLISSFHLVCVLILIVLSRIRKYFLLIVVIIYIILPFIYFSALLPNSLLTFFCLLQKLLLMVQIIFEFFVKSHFINIADCCIFFRYCLGYIRLVRFDSRPRFLFWFLNAMAFYINLILINTGLKFSLLQLFFNILKSLFPTFLYMR